MEQDVENNVRKDSIMLFDDGILNKLRRCNIVPRSPSDFQVFVKSLTKDTISDDVIQEVWKQIYPGHASLPTSERDSDSQKLTINDSSKRDESVQTVEEIKQPCVGKSNKTNVLVKEDCKEEQNSSDCVIIEMIVGSSGANNSHSDSGLVSDDDNKSDSDESVEILDSSESEEDKHIKRPCLMHGGHKRKAQHGNCCPKRKSMHIEANSVESKENENCEKSVNKGKQQKDKKGRRRELKMLMSEVKHLRSAFVNFVLNLKCSTSTDNEEVSGDLNNMRFTPVNNQKAGGNESFGPKQTRKKTGSKNTRTVSSTEKLHASAFVEVKMSRARETTRSPSKRKRTAKKSSEQPPIVVDLDSDDEDKEKRKKFPWRENIVNELKSTRGKWMTVEKLKRRIIARYYCCRGNISNNTPVKFLQYLHSTAGVIVVGEKAIYSNKPIIKVSSKSERTQYVLEKHKTTKECKVS